MDKPLKKIQAYFSFSTCYFMKSQITNTRVIIFNPSLMNHIRNICAINFIYMSF